MSHAEREQPSKGAGPTSQTRGPEHADELSIGAEQR